MGWTEFADQLVKSLKFADNKLRKLNVNTLEKIRLLMTILNLDKDFDFENVRPEIAKKLYIPKYRNWNRNNELAVLFNRYIKNEKHFFPHHVRISPFPNFKAWNLGMIFFEPEKLFKIIKDDEIEYFPLQIFEDKSGNSKYLLCLVPADLIQKDFKDFQILNFSIRNNFNIFEVENYTNVSLKPKSRSFFDSYVKFLDERSNENGDYSFYKNTYTFNLDFKKKVINQPLVNQYKTSKTINEFNLLYDKDLSNFSLKYFPNPNTSVRNPLKQLFISRATFSDFNPRNNFLLIIKKKNNVQFSEFISFLQNWTYQTLIYELKDKIILYGFLLPKFNYSKEIVYLNELFEKIDTNFTFDVINQDLRQSNLSIYTLPCSNQFSNIEKSWNLHMTKIDMSISLKEEFISKVIKEERQNKDFLK